MRRPTLLEYLLPLDIELGSFISHRGSTASITQRRQDFYTAYVKALKELEADRAQVLEFRGPEQQQNAPLHAHGNGFGNAYYPCEPRRRERAHTLL